VKFIRFFLTVSLSGFSWTVFLSGFACIVSLYGAIGVI
jgi:hypothetical protein